MEFFSALPGSLFVNSPLSLPHQSWMISILLRRFVPISPQPIRDQRNCLCVQYLFAAERRHAVVFLIVKIGMLRIADKINQPFARAITSQIWSGRIFVLFMKLVTV